MAVSNRISRRQFLRTNAGSAAAVLAGPAVLRAAQSNQPAGDDICCGMIGTGGRGTAILNALKNVPGARVTALCDIDAKNLNQASEIVADDNPKLFKDYRKMLDFKDLDAVFVATPCHLHKVMFVAVLKSGRHCYGEKPMALNVADLNEIVRVSKSSKGIFQIGTQLRYDGKARAAVRAIHEGKIGKPIFIRMSRHNDWDMAHDRKWLFKRKFSGDTIVEQAVHEFDACNWVFKGVAVRAAGFGGQAVLFEPEGRDLMDHYTLSLDYGKNKKVSYSHSWISGSKAPINNIQLAVLGSEATIDLLQATIYPRTGRRFDKTESIKLEPELKGHRNRLAVEAFFDCCRQGKKPLANVETGRDATLVALLGRMALDTERVVTMKELLA
ncbi:MAG: Gfo/Idh/MocA family oxidoreductase [Planctomycetota bacterium]|nr:MAG: Gfo/Idh/MocA family oxidoreductase [Planctomycetota bacterium]